jgi:luciferase family oxidoreductase group 1
MAGRMTRFSVLDLVPVSVGQTTGAALAAAAQYAAHAERVGCHRYWVAEHHGMAGVAGAATSVVLAHVGHHTHSIRIGAGGIMLPNHSPLLIAEQFGTLDALFPGRIDLGLGRAPGADMRFVRALDKDVQSAAAYFPQHVAQLRAHFTGEPDPGFAAFPGRGAAVEMWILGSSLFGAQLAAMLGLPYAFASHFAPDHLDEAIAVYRQRFQPSAVLEQPYVAAAFNAFAADTADEAALLASSMEQAFVALRTGTPGKLPPPVPGFRASLPPPARAMLDHVLQASAIGTVDHVRERLAAFIARTGADEIIFAGSMHDPAARLRSLTLTMAAATS